MDADGGDSSPCEYYRGDEGDTGKEEAFEGEDDGGVLDLDPLELERGPYTDEEGCFRAEEDCEEREGEGVKGGEERGAEEECDLGGEEREPDGEEGDGFESGGGGYRVEDVCDHKA